MPYNPNTDATAGNISRHHAEMLQAIIAQQKRSKRATLEYLIEQEYSKLLKEAQNVQ